jgi:hypothetical protein
LEVADGLARSDLHRATLAAAWFTEQQEPYTGDNFVATVELVKQRAPPAIRELLSFVVELPEK